MIEARYARIVNEGFWKKLLEAGRPCAFRGGPGGRLFLLCRSRDAADGYAASSRGAGLVRLPASVMPEFVFVRGSPTMPPWSRWWPALVRRHIKERHYRRARAALGIPEPVTDEEIWGWMRGAPGQRTTGTGWRRSVRPFPRRIRIRAQFRFRDGARLRPAVWPISTISPKRRAHVGLERDAAQRKIEHFAVDDFAVRRA